MRVVGALVLMGGARFLSAQPPGMEDKVFMEASMAVMAFDGYAERCATKGGFSVADSAVIAAWQSKNGIDRIRARTSELEAEQPPDKRVGQARSAVNVLLKVPFGSPCTRALALVQNPKSQYATVAPEMMRALGAPTPAVVAASTPPNQTAPVTAPVAAPVAASPGLDELLREVDSFAFASGMTMGVGGFLTTRIYPVILLRNGEALTDVGELVAAGGLAQHRRQHPGDWTRWRRQGNDIQLLEEGTWEKLPFNRTYPQLPEGFRLDGFFRHLGGAGTVAIGGDQSVTAWSEYHFFPDGQVRRGGGAGARSGEGTGATVTSSVAPERRGRYRVQGLEVVISWDNGTTERRILIADPNDPKTAIWLDGVGYVRRTPRP